MPPRVIALLQRVEQAHVSVQGARVASIGTGILALIGVRREDTVVNAQRLAGRILNYRMFGDEDGKMNLNLLQFGGDLLVVPQFTLAANTRAGLRPSFAPAAPPAEALQLFDALFRAARERHPRIASGVFGANMQISLVNDGPVTFWLES